MYDTSGIGTALSMGFSVGIVLPFLLNSVIGGLCGYFMPGLSVVRSACWGALLSVAVWCLELAFLYIDKGSSMVWFRLAIAILIGAVATYLSCRWWSSKQMRQVASE